MDLVELKALIQELRLNDNGKVCLLVAYDRANSEYVLVNCDEDGNLKTVAG